MKKLALYLLLTTTSLSVMARSYTDLREYVNKGLYNRQRGLMEQGKYFKCIDLYLQEAEKTLAVVKYFKENPESELAMPYFTALLDCNVATFHYHVKKNNTTQQNLSRTTNRLLTLIEQIKAEAHLEIDVQEELKKTTELLKKANVFYYKKLGIGSKISLGIFI